MNPARISATLAENPPSFPSYGANPDIWHGESLPAEWAQHL